MDIPSEEARKMVIETKFKKALITRTKNYGCVENPDGTVSISMTLSFEGSINNAINSKGKDAWGAKEAVRLYNIAREEWLKGNFEAVADLFGVIV